jgi:hypothetical protein
MYRKQYSPEDDQMTVSFWVLAGGIVASLALKSAVFVIVSIVLCYVILRTDSNIKKGLPYWSPGRFSEHLYDSYFRLIKGQYKETGYYSRVKKRRKR